MNALCIKFNTSKSSFIVNANKARFARAKLQNETVLMIFKHCVLTVN